MTETVASAGRTLDSTSHVNVNALLDAISAQFGESYRTEAVRLIHGLDAHYLVSAAPTTPPQTDAAEPHLLSLEERVARLEQAAMGAGVLRLDPTAVQPTLEGRVSRLEALATTHGLL